VAYGAEAAVIVVDRDRTPGRERLGKLVAQREGLRSDRERPLLVPISVGVAVETIEAWLLADEVVLCEVLGLPHPAQPKGSPEALDGTPGQANHPKCVLNQHLSRDTHPGRHFLDQAMEIARHMDLEKVARVCPQGFAPFREDVISELGPHFR
jgi:hypothetical protein